MFFRVLTSILSGKGWAVMAVWAAVQTGLYEAWARDSASELAASPTHPGVQLRFLDSATGYAVQPEEVAARGLGAGQPETRLRREDVNAAGRAALRLPRGRYALRAMAEGYRPVAGEFQLEADNPYRLQFLLDPVEEPAELHPDVIAGLVREGATLIQGFIVDEDSGAPLAGVVVKSWPSGVAAASDRRGFFRLHVPVPAAGQEAGLEFEKAGYRTEERRPLELWSRGDWTYRIRLERGGGRVVVDESLSRRRAPGTTGAPAAGPGSDTETVESGEAPAADEPLIQFATAATNATVRVPRNIRVLRSDNVTIDYVSLTYYTRAVLPSEWIASWGNILGGSNSLNAGAVAARCYAISRINNAGSTSTYDICGTSACQVYNPANFNSLTDRAVTYTADWVLLSGTAIAGTEYSAENNQLGASCGDGFTAPTGGCLYDPVCAGETTYGHGRGMCQWGTARWATGRRMAGRTTSDATPNGYPRRSWTWIVQHYYPTLSFVKGASLVVGDDVKALKTLDVRACAGGTITNGTACALVTTKAAGATGVILGGPVVVTNDGKGFTWYQVQWNDAGPTIGWSAENYLERVFSVPAAPGGLTATAVSPSQINLSWTDSDDVEAGFRVERAPASTGPWIRLATLDANTVSFSDRNLAPGSTWFYRVQAYNAGGASGYGAVAGATTPGMPPVWNPIGSQAVAELDTLSLPAVATASEGIQLITDFEPFISETANGVVLFRYPRYSGSTSSFVGSAPDLAAVTDTYVTNGHGTGLVLRVSCQFTNASDPWLRLTTSGAATLPNPVIDFTRKLRFDIYTDKPIGIAVGCRETVTPAGTAIGADGGTSGSSIEWVGATGKSGTAPVPTRVVAASNWTTLTFDLPHEPVFSFTGGNGVLSTASGLGVLEHLAIVPMAGLGVYNLYLDNFAVVTDRSVTYSLAPGAPAGAAVNPVTGLFTWTPTESDGPGTYGVSLVATDDSPGALRATNSFSVTVAEVNSAPALPLISDQAVHAGTALAIDCQGTDGDLPANTLTYSLSPGAPAGAGIDPVSGLFHWTPGDAQANLVHPVTVRVEDNGTPPLSASRTFNIQVAPRPALQTGGVEAGSVVLSWSAIPGQGYRVQYREQLGTGQWNDLTPDIVASTGQARFTNTLAGPAGFYRVVVLPR